MNRSSSQPVICMDGDAAFTCAEPPPGRAMVTRLWQAVSQLRGSGGDASSGIPPAVNRLEIIPNGYLTCGRFSAGAFRGGGRGSQQWGIVTCAIS